MGLTALESLEAIVEANYRNYKQYQRELADLPGIEVLTYNEDEKRNYQYVVLKVNRDELGFSRDQLVDILQHEHVMARRYFYPGCHRMEPYRSHFPNAGLLLPHTEVLTGRVLSLPTGTSISPEAVTLTCHIIRLVALHRHEIARRLNDRASHMRSTVLEKER